MLSGNNYFYLDVVMHDHTKEDRKCFLRISVDKLNTDSPELRFLVVDEDKYKVDETLYLYYNNSLADLDSQLKVIFDYFLREIQATKYKN